MREGVRGDTGHATGRRAGNSSKRGSAMAAVERDIFFLEVDFSEGGKLTWVGEVAGLEIVVCIDRGFSLGDV